MNQEIKQEHVRFSWNPIHPHRDWKKLLITLICLFIAIVAWSAYLFISSSRAAEPLVTQAAEPARDTSVRLDALASYFEER